MSPASRPRPLLTLNAGFRLRARGFARRAFYRSRTVRTIAAFGLGLIPDARRPDVAHISLHKDTADGPIQRDEALFLHGLVRVVRPRTIVEIGFFRGVSAFNFLRALDADARLYSFDVDPACQERARENFGHDPRLIVRTKSQTALTLDDLDGRLADFVFLDASHDLALNKATFDRLLPMMAGDAILAVHDTGTIPGELLPQGHYFFSSQLGWIGDRREVEPGERAFVNWVLERHPEFAQIHLHSLRVLRCGITLLQRSAPLARPSATAAEDSSAQSGPYRP
jgi:predicted O-methyltransferase YrrM